MKMYSGKNKMRQLPRFVSRWLRPWTYSYPPTTTQPYTTSRTKSWAFQWRNILICENMLCRLCIPLYLRLLLAQDIYVSTI